MTTNIYRTQAYGLIMCGYVCIAFVDFMLKAKRLLDHTISFSANDYDYNKIILKYFHELKRWKKNYIALFVAGIENLKSLKYYTS